MPNEKQSPKELKVTDKRIFTPDGDIREEFQNEINPAESRAATATEPPQPNAAEPAQRKHPAGKQEADDKADNCAPNQIWQVRWHRGLTRHKISCREPSVHATQHTLTPADTRSVNGRLARGQLHRLVRASVASDRV